VPTFTLASTTATQLFAQASAIAGDVGVVGIIILAGGVPLFFYVVGRLLGLIPKGRGKKA
jgi:hypothetical protein